jgi:putative DNA primase/helicase
VTCISPADGQVKRAASKFALAAMAGELAIQYGIVPWPKGDAIKAAAKMFDAWCAGRGTVANDEPRQILRRVSDFIDRHGDFDSRTRMPASH